MSENFAIIGIAVGLIIVAPTLVDLVREIVKMYDQ